MQAGHEDQEVHRPERDRDPNNSPSDLASQLRSKTPVPQDQQGHGDRDRELKVVQEACRRRTKRPKLLHEKRIWRAQCRPHELLSGDDFRSGHLDDLQCQCDRDRPDHDAAFVLPLVSAVGKDREEAKHEAGNRPAERLQEYDPCPTRALSGHTIGDRKAED